MNSIVEPLYVMTTEEILAGIRGDPTHAAVRRDWLRLNGLDPDGPPEPLPPKPALLDREPPGDFPLAAYLTMLHG